MVDDVNKTVGGGNVRLNNCCIYATTFNGNGFIVALIYNVKVKELFVNLRWNLNELQGQTSKKGLKKLLKSFFHHTYLIIA